MALVSSSLPNLVGGVSQQPASLRVANAHDEAINTWPSLISGLQKRSGSEVVARLSTAVSDQFRGHTYSDPISGQRFFIMLEDNSIRVFNESGEEKTVNGDLSTDYLDFSGDALQNGSMFTVGDTTFILNKTVTVEAEDIAEDGSRVNPENRWTIFIEAAVANSYYTVYAGGTQLCSFLTSTNTSSDTALESTSEIAEELADQMPGNKIIADSVTYYDDSENPSGGSRTIDLYEETGLPDSVTITVNSVYISSGSVTDNGDGTLTASPPSGGVWSGTTTVSYVITADSLASNVQRYGSVIALTVPDGVTLSVYDEGNAGDSISVINTSVQDFDDLPPYEEEGRILKVYGDTEDSGDDYYVVMDDEGLWVETYGYGEGRAIKAETMPHTLVYDQSTDTFTFGPYEWEGRLAGDEETSPDPTFVGRQINSLFIHQSRLGILSDENILFSEAGYYDNFWRTTVVQLLDSDPIDIAAVSGRVSLLHHAVPFNRDLLLFSDYSQYIVDTGDILSPSTAVATYTTSYPASVYQEPVNVGSYVYFVDDTGTFLRLLEYYVDNNSLTDNAEDVSIQVPEYLRGPIRLMRGSSRINTLMLMGEDRSTLYTYNFTFGGTSKIQSSWGKWTFEGEIVYFDFVDNYLYLFINYEDGSFLERIKMEEDAVRSASDFPVCLDHRIQLSDCTASYDAVTNVSTVTTPFSYIDGAVMVTPPGTEDAGLRFDLEKVDDTTFTTYGDVTQLEDAFIGIPYEFYWRLSPQFVRETKGNGTTIVQDGRLSLRYMSLYYSKTSAFNVKVTLSGGREYNYPFEGRSLGSANNVLGLVSVETGEFRFPIMGENVNTTIEVTNDSPYHCTFTACEWMGQFRTKASRRI